MDFPWNKPSIFGYPHLWKLPIFQDTSSNHGFMWCDIPDITWLLFENIDGDLIFTYILTIKHVGIEVMNDGWLLQGGIPKVYWRSKSIDGSGELGPGNRRYSLWCETCFSFLIIVLLSGYTSRLHVFVFFFTCQLIVLYHSVTEWLHQHRMATWQLIVL